MKDRFAGRFDRVVAHTPGPLVDECAVATLVRGDDGLFRTTSGDPNCPSTSASAASR